MKNTEEVPVGQGREKIWAEEINKILKKYRPELVANVKKRIAEAK